MVYSAFLQLPNFFLIFSCVSLWKQGSFNKLISLIWDQRFCWPTVKGFWSVISTYLLLRRWHELHHLFLLASRGGWLQLVQLIAILKIGTWLKLFCDFQCHLCKYLWEKYISFYWWVFMAQFTKAINKTVFPWCLLIAQP